jgi:hypothetical protein
VRSNQVAWPSVTSLFTLTEAMVSECASASTQLPMRESRIVISLQICVLTTRRFSAVVIAERTLQ